MTTGQPSIRRAPLAPRTVRPRAGSGRFLAVSLALHVAAFVALRLLLPATFAAGERAVVVASRTAFAADLAPEPEPPPPPAPLPERPESAFEEVTTDEPLPVAWQEDEPFERGAISVTDPLAGSARTRVVSRGRGRPAPTPPESAPVEASSAIAPSASPPPPPERQVVRAPVKLLRAPQPEYPEDARTDGIEGTVRLVVEVLEDGRVGEIQIAESSGCRALDEAAVRGVRRWKFEPAREDGVAVRSVVSVPKIRFRLDRA